MSENDARGILTRARKSKRERDAQKSVALLGFLNDVVVTHVLSLRRGDMPDPADLAKLRTVSRATRNEVDVKGCPVEEHVVMNQ